MEKGFNLLESLASLDDDLEKAFKVLGRSINGYKVIRSDPDDEKQYYAEQESYMKAYKALEVVKAYIRKGKEIRHSLEG